MLNHKKSTRAFTLVELLLAMLIVGAVLWLSVAWFGPHPKQLKSESSVNQPVVITQILAKKTAMPAGEPLVYQTSLSGTASERITFTGTAVKNGVSKVMIRQNKFNPKNCTDPRSVLSENHELATGDSVVLSDMIELSENNTGVKMATSITVVEIGKNEAVFDVRRITLPAIFTVN